MFLNGYCLYKIKSNLVTMKVLRNDETTFSVVSEKAVSNSTRKISSEIHEAAGVLDLEKKLEQEVRYLKIYHYLWMQPYSVFSLDQKRVIVILAAIASFISPFTANIYYPAITPLALDLEVSVELINHTVTAYLIFQGISPTFFGTLGDTYGRRPIFLLTFLIYIAACTGLALARQYWLVLVLRMLQSCGSARAGVIGDITMAEERGGYMGVWSLGSMSGLTLGPIVGGVIAQFLGWRAIFWFLTIFAAIYLVVLFFFLPETLRSLVGNGSILPRGINARPSDLRRCKSTPPLERQSPKNPFLTLKLLKEKDVVIILFIGAIYWAALYMSITSLAPIFIRIYGVNLLQVGLCYFAYGVGSLIGSYTSGRLMDWSFQRTKFEEGENMAIEHARMRILPLYFGIFIVCQLCYGWVLQEELHISIPLIIQFFLGISNTSLFNVTTTLVVDLFPQNGSAATASNNLVRCLIGAGGVSIVNPMIETVGIGWTFTTSAVVCALVVPLAYLEYKQGPLWRAQRAERFRISAHEI
ncbi:Quinidine resistance protein 1 [Neolecta irregularis DAH-3]|uniref:Quinidine resistance protein 1 n=1 Tax=Neolecta irregularis (strain DAH-3) TaxID=1198029 RepID=A0A1U7LLA2_NEOID|nr:Quinidine resistance protein 1 [Neolecta irregularis DAH-3]|eukprot:OLL23322.1 Quinidine resistance protein 1 [Neolecta irregularis DAH-3]